MLPQIPGAMLFGTVNKEEGEGIEQDTVAQHEHARHARPLTSLHWRRIWAELNETPGDQSNPSKFNQSSKQAPNKVADSSGRSGKNRGTLCLNQLVGMELLVSLLHKDKSD